MRLDVVALRSPTRRSAQLVAIFRHLKPPWETIDPLWRMTPTRRWAAPEIFPSSSTSCQTMRFSGSVGKLRSHFAESSLGRVQGVFANPDLRRVQLAYAGSSIGNFAYGVAIAVYAYQHGGATAVGVVTADPAGDRRPHRAVRGLARRPLPARAGDARLRSGPAGHRRRRRRRARHRALAGAHRLRRRDDDHDPRHDLPAGRGGADPAARPIARGADRRERLVEHVRQPRRLRRAVDRRVPARAQRAGGRARRSTPLTFAWSAYFIARVHTPAGAETARATPRTRGRGSLVAGFRAIAAEPRLRLLIGLYGAQCFVAGALGVFVVVIALQLLGLGTAGVGLLQAACGVGALARRGRRAVAGRARAHRRRLRDRAAALGPAAAARRRRADRDRGGARARRRRRRQHAGRHLGDDAAAAGRAARRRGARLRLSRERDRRLDRTRRARHARSDRAARRSRRAVRDRRAAAGALAPPLAQPRRDRRGGTASRPSGSRRCARCRSSPRCRSRRSSGSPGKLADVTLPAGATLFEAGDHGDRFYVLHEGSLEIALPGETKVEEAPSFVGEIALLRDVPRTASVRARTDVVALGARARRLPRRGQRPFAQPRLGRRARGRRDSGP